jgi:RNA polymerase sigma-70 factor (ECF subfamily)
VSSRHLTAKEGCLVEDPLQRFTGLYDRYYRNVLRYALQHAERGSAEDVASETFLITWRQLPDVPEQPLPWLLAVARNLLRQQAGAGRRRQLLAARIVALTGADDLIAWDAGEHVVERTAALEALASLPERDVEALTLMTWHGLDAHAAAAVVGCSPRAFTVRLHRARRRLAAALRSAEQATLPSARRLTAAVPGSAARARPPRAHGRPVHSSQITPVRSPQITSTQITSTQGN